MILHKRYIRDIRESRSFYLSSTLLTVLALMLFYLYYISGTGIMEFTDHFFEEQKIEDADFSTYLEIPEKEIRKYEDRYDLELEKQEYINLETEGVTARVFRKTEKVNLYKVTEGKDAEKDNEIVISEGYAQNRNIKIGDRIRIREKQYVVSGFMERPDYLYMLQNLTDSYKNVSSFFICCMTDQAFQELGETNFLYLVRYRDQNQRAFREDVNEHYIMNSYTDAEDNARISMVCGQAELFIVTSYFILFLMPLVVVVLISMILCRKIKSEQKMIGTLSALGYTENRITGHYAGFAAIPGVVGGILATVIVSLCADSYGALGLMDYEPIDVDFSLKVPQMLLGILIPTAMYLLAAVFTIKRLLKNDTTVLLLGAAGRKNRVRTFLAGKKISFRIKFSVRSILGNPGRTFVLFLGVLLGNVVILLSFGLFDSIKNISDVTVKQMEHYEHQYVLNELKSENTYGGETLLLSSVEDRDGNTISIYGADKNHLIGLKDLNGAEIQADDGYLITSLYARITGIKEGERITVMNPLSMKEYRGRVTGIVDNNFIKGIYTSEKNVSRISGIAEGQYNVILSREKLDIPDREIITTISRDTVTDQFQAALMQMNTILVLFVGIGMILCVIVIYISVNMVVTENRSDISMLRVLGYDDKKIRKFLLQDNLYVVIAAMLVSIPGAHLMGRALFSSFIDVLGYWIDMHIEPVTYPFSMLLILAGYYLSRALVSRKIRKVDMVESLKDHRE